MEYKIKVNVSEEDYKKFCYDFYLHGAGTVVLLILIVLLLAFMAFSAFLSFRFTRKISEFLPLIVFILLYVFVFLSIGPENFQGSTNQTILFRSSMN